MTKHSLDEVLEQAMTAATEIVEAAMRSMATEPPKQEDLRERFRAVAGADTAEEFEAGYQDWLKDLGQESWDHQVGLALARARRRL